MFSFKVVGDTTNIKHQLQIRQRLQDRTKVSPAEFDQIMNLREQTHNQKKYAPVGTVDEENLFKGTYYLNGIDEKYRRSYIRF